MISRAQGKTWAAGIAVGRGQRLSALEKAMLKWVVVDPEDRLLDADVGCGLMAEYLRRNMQCEVCGVSDDMESVRAARNRLQNCDIVYAPPGDIPWREDAFDTVLMKFDGGDAAVFHRRLKEASRVLRPGGQLILGTMCYPAPVHLITGMFGEKSPEEHGFFQKREVTELLNDASFENITWQRTGLATGVMIAWKQKAGVSEMLNAG